MLALDDAGGLTPRVADFGLVKGGSDRERTRTGVVMGTVAYAAPEQLLDSSTADDRADLWSIGVMLYELLRGARPFSGRTLGAVQAAHLKGPDLTGLDDKLAALLKALLQPDPARRLASCELLLQRLPEGTPLDAGSGLAAAVLRFRDENLQPSGRALPQQSTLKPAPPIAEPQAPESGGLSKRRVLAVTCGALALTLGAVALRTQVSWDDEPPTSEVEGAPQVPVEAPVEVQAEVPAEGQAESSAEPEEVLEEGAPSEPVTLPTPVAVPPTEPAVVDAVLEEEPEEEPEAIEPATVIVTGDPVNVRLVSAEGRIFMPGTVPPGRYTLEATLPSRDNQVKEPLGELVSGQVVRVHCDDTFSLCSIKGGP